MKYKLISKTLEETISFKVVVDGFDYYVSDELAKAKDVFLNETNCPKEFLYKKVIATNNPNIDLPQVIDEIKELAMAELKNKWSHLYTFGYPKKPYPTNYENDLNFVLVSLYKSQETHSFSEDDMIEFAEWYAINNISEEDTSIGLFFYYKKDLISKKELLKLWKEQQIKTIYYETL